MRTITTLAMLIILKTYVFAQLAIINDKDGFVNIREEENSKSRVVGRLFEGDIFMVASDSDSNEWWGVFYSVKLNELEEYKKDYYIQNNLTDGKEIYFQGYIHKSRFLLIDNLKKINTRSIQRSKRSISILNDTIKFYLKIGSFEESKHIIKRDKFGDVISIDGQIPKGVIEPTPQTEIEEISLIFNNKLIEFPKKYFQDLYEPNLEGINLFEDPKGNLILSMPYNSDGAGAGAYFAAWLIKDGKVLRRYTDSL